MARLFKHRTVGPKKGNGAILIGKIEFRKQKSKRERINDKLDKTDYQEIKTKIEI